MSVPGRVLRELLCVTVQLGACHAVLDDVVALARQVPGLGDAQVRAVLMALGKRAARLLEEEIR
ncbi:MAG: hypothetical protein JO115_24625 [Pseudonocardiales bacterium]|nr:hypothetical protein [Pseudonocardiales bacterium]